MSLKAFIVLYMLLLLAGMPTFQYRVEAMDFLLEDNPAEAKVKIRECLLNAMERYTL